ncbi:hypothetical protein [Citrobacter sp. wls826]|uniref:hypothetical protein n=1 Tax=Citrobacter sp. wls826 TaxID=2576415 RepID=UPI0010CA1DDB|nr:hypothetical protein [Citrobacter sp. wls826]TKU21991.1 hypothetical protein FDW87_08455 [Citrobacter sp. wls826]TKV30118.1 hypothetical protein FDX20_27255 [Citrobacter sp. TBCS-11]
MLKKIIPNSNSRLINDILLPKARISESTQKKNTEQEFRKKLTKIYKDAESNINNLKVNAIAEGFEQGFLELITVMSSYFLDYQKVFHTLQKDIMDIIRKALEASTQQPDTILHLFDEWLNSQHLEGDVIYIVIPKRCHFLSSKISMKLESCWDGKVDISYSEDFCFIVKNNKHIIEFRPSDYFNSLLPYYNTTFKKSELENSCISEKAYSELIESMNNNLMAIKNKKTDMGNSND